MSGKSASEIAVDIVLLSFAQDAKDAGKYIMKIVGMTARSSEINSYLTDLSRSDDISEEKHREALTLLHNIAIPSPTRSKTIESVLAVQRGDVVRLANPLAL